MDSVCLEGEAGDIGGLNWAGDDDGVEGPRNDASRLMKSRAYCWMFVIALFDSDLGAKPISKITFFIFL